MTGVAGYVADAEPGSQLWGYRLNIPALKPGQTVLDLGSGAGLDVFVARNEVGETGHVIGVDMTAEMVAKSRQNAEQSGFDNVEFRLGENRTPAGSFQQHRRRYFKLRAQPGAGQTTCLRRDFQGC